MRYPEGTYYPLTFFEGGWKSDAMSYPKENLELYGDFVVMSDTMKDYVEAAHGQKISEVNVAPTPDGKPPYKRQIKTEAETVAELKGINISTEADPEYSEETKDEDSPDPEG